MNFLFGKKPSQTALAEVLADAEAIAKAEMSKPKYKNYTGAEVMIDVPVRVLPENEPSYETTMKASMLKAFLLKPGVRVIVQGDVKKQEHVSLTDELPAILARNPQLRKEQD